MLGLKFPLKHIAIASVLGFIFIFAEGYITHQILLMQAYEATMNLWRPVEDMNAYFPLVLLTQFLAAFFIAVLYAQNHENKGIGEGLRFGVLVGLIFSVFGLQALAYMPITTVIAVGWALEGLAIGIGLGIINALIHKGIS